MTPMPAPHAPRFCPNPACPFHLAPAGWRAQRDGYYHRDAPPRRIQRYRCRHCGRRFSEQTFRTTYWLRRPELLEPVLRAEVACSCLRQIGRSLGCSPQTVLTHLCRLGRHCLLFHEGSRPKGPTPESLAMDGLVSFEYSQYHPTMFHVLVGRDSHYFHGFTASRLRRSGSMRPGQKRKRAELERRHGRPDPRATEKDCAALLKACLPAEQSIELHTDEHQDYPRAVRQAGHLVVAHRTISSRAKRDQNNPLFPVNLLDLLVRHSAAGHKRETIAFAKRLQMAIWRMSLFLVWRNHMKWFSERRRGGTPMMRLGLAERPLQVRQLLRERLFASQVPLPEPWRGYYYGEVDTPTIANCRRHRLKYAA